MGLIRRLTLTPGVGTVDVHIVIGVTEYGCLLAPSFASEARRLLSALSGIGSIDIELDGEFDWVPEDMSAAYRQHLAERRGAINRVMLPMREPPDRSATPVRGEALGPVGQK